METINLPEIFNYENPKNDLNVKFFKSVDRFSFKVCCSLISLGVNLPEPFNSLTKYPKQTLDENLKMTGYFFHLVTGQSYGDITLRVVINTNGKILFIFQTSLTGNTWTVLSPEVLSKDHPVIADCQREMQENKSLISSSEFAILLEEIASIMKKNYKDLVT